MEPFVSSDVVEAESQSLDLRSELLGEQQDHRVYIGRLLWTERALLWRVTRNGTLLAILVAFLLPVRYTSTTQLMPPESESGTGMAMMAALAGGTGEGKSAGGTAMPSGLASLLGMKNQGDLFVSILGSRTVQDALINRFDLRKIYWDRYYSKARKDLAHATEISADRKSGVIKIQVTDRSRERAVQMAQAYVEELDRTLAQVSTSAARRERIFLEERLRTAKVELNQAEVKFSEFASKNATLDVPEQAKAQVTAAAELEGQIIAAKSELQGLEQIYTPENVRVRSLRQRIAELERQLKRLGGAAVPQLADSNDKLPAEDIYPAIRQLPILGVPWADLYREVKVQETVYELLTAQYELAKVDEAKEIPTVRVLDPPQLPERRSSPPRVTIVIVSGLLCFLLTSTWLWTRDRWRHWDPTSPGKQLLEEVGLSLGSQLNRVPWVKLKPLF